MLLEFGTGEIFRILLYIIPICVLQAVQDFNGSIVALLSYIRFYFFLSTIPQGQRMALVGENAAASWAGYRACRCTSSF